MDQLTSRRLADYYEAEQAYLKSKERRRSLDDLTLALDGCEFVCTLGALRLNAKVMKWRKLYDEIKQELDHLQVVAV